MSHHTYVVQFGKQDKVLVLQWLIMYLMDDTWQLTTNNTACVRYENGVKKYRWRMALRLQDHRVMLHHEQDVQLFVLAWGGQVVDWNSNRQ